jgi:hypothetical protein
LSPSLLSAFSFVWVGNLVSDIKEEHRVSVPENGVLRIQTSVPSAYPVRRG